MIDSSKSLAKCGSALIGLDLNFQIHALFHPRDQRKREHPGSLAAQDRQPSITLHISSRTETHPRMPDQPSSFLLLPGSPASSSSLIVGIETRYYLRRRAGQRRPVNI
ncbi:hypothetical protein ACKLNR_003827 [Fusarium oxysporum f. sp. zingiberi]